MSNMTYDYPGLKEAHAKLGAEIEAFKSAIKSAEQTGIELVAENNAEGVKSTMEALVEKQKATLKIMDESFELATAALNNARELHIANGGVE